MHACHTKFCENQFPFLLHQNVLLVRERDNKFSFLPSVEGRAEFSLINFKDPSKAGKLTLFQIHANTPFTPDFRTNTYTLVSIIHPRPEGGSDALMKRQDEKEV